MTPLPWHVERGFASAHIVAADDTVVADGLSLADAEAIVAALGVVEAAREFEAEYERDETETYLEEELQPVRRALAVYEKASER